MFKQSLRMTARDWRAGELRFLLLALIIAVASLAAVGFFVDRIRTGLNQNAHQLLGADVLISADQPIAASWRAEAERRGLRVADTVSFPSMAQAGEGEQTTSQLAAIKAVSPGYPLRGHLTLAVPNHPEGEIANDIPASGTVWVDAALLPKLNIASGGHLKLGDAEFKVTRIIQSEQDKGVSFTNFVPRVMLSTTDLGATRLIQFGSRVNYRLQVAGETNAAEQFKNWIQTTIEHDKVRGVTIESLESNQQDMRATLDKAEQFLSLVALLSAMLAAVAVAMAARRFMLRHVDACAMLRCLGLTQNQVTVVYLLEFLFVGLIGSVIGALLGFAAHFVLLEWLGKLVSNDLPPARWLPGIQALITGLVLLVGFALPPILQLRNVPHNRVIRREQDLPQAMTVATYGLGLLSFLALLLWQAGNLKLGLMTAGGFLGGLLVFSAIVWLALKGLRNLRTMFNNSSWHFAVAALQRRGSATIVQVVALALGLMALLLLTMIRSDLMDSWRKSIPADAPNQFIINIEPDQRVPITERFVANSISQPMLYPMIRGRLTAINDQAINNQSYNETRAKHLVEREFNISTMQELPAMNTISAGHWYNNSKPEASVEEGLAKTLNLHLGDKLTFEVAGQPVSATITSLRKLEWGSMRVNFFVIINPGAVRDMPSTWITAFHLPQTNTTFVNELIRDFPNITVIDIGSILAQIQNVIDQVVIAVEFLFLFTLASGILVLYAVLVGSQEERTRDAGILRALGATRAQLSRAQWIEFGLIGGLAGMLAASGAVGVGWALARFAFDFAWHFNPLIWLIGVAAGAICAFIGGWVGLRHVLTQPPLQTLREA